MQAWLWICLWRDLSWRDNRWVLSTYDKHWPCFKDDSNATICNDSWLRMTKVRCLCLGSSLRLGISRQYNKMITDSTFRVQSMWNVTSRLTMQYDKMIWDEISSNCRKSYEWSYGLFIGKNLVTRQWIQILLGMHCVPMCEWQPDNELSTMMKWSTNGMNYVIILPWSYWFILLGQSRVDCK